MLLNTWGDLGEDLINYIATLPDQRDPYKVRTRNSITKWFYVTEAFERDDYDKGKVVRLIGEKTYSDLPETDVDNPPSNDELILSEQFPWFPYHPISGIGTNWELNWQDAKYIVKNVRSRNIDTSVPANDSTLLANEVWVSGGDLTILFDYMTNRRWDTDIDSDSVQGTVVIGTTDGSQCPVVGLPVLPVRLTRNASHGGTSIYDSTVAVRIPLQGGTYLELYDVPTSDENIGELKCASGTTITSSVCGTVNYLSGSVTIDLANNSSFSAISPSEIRAKYIVRGYFMKFNVPSMIEYLAGDFGFNMDQEDPEDAQRSTLANITKYWGIKSTEESYRIRGAISFFDVQMHGLFRVNSAAIAALLPSDHVFQIGTGLYTDISPLYIKYDHIASDELFYDYNSGGSTLWVPVVDNMLVFETDDRWDGMSIGQAYAVDVTQGYYGQVSSVNTNVRGPVTVNDGATPTPGGVVPLTRSELNELGWQNGWKYTLKMKRCQYEAFNFQEELFALSVYDYNATPANGTPPSIDDTLYYIRWNTLVTEPNRVWQYDGYPTADPREDIGYWTILIQFGVDTVTSPISVLDDIAIHYLPKFDTMNCYYCRSNSMRAIVSATNEAYDYYDSYDKIDSAIVRLKKKIRELSPIHSRVIEWEVTRKFEDTIYGAKNNADTVHALNGIEFVGNTEVLLTVQYRGDATTSGKAIGLWIDSEEDPGVHIWDPSLLVSPLPDPWYDADATASDWIDVCTDATITINDEEKSPGVPWKIYLHADASATSTSGDVRFKFAVTKRES
jgi:hypothetical protein